MPDPTRPLLVVRHVAWEGPHRILRAFSERPIAVVDVLEGQPLPDHDDVHAAVFMGGPMSVHDTDEHPGLVDELAWMRQAVERGTPVLGVCLGAQLLASALGGSVTPGRALELGVAPVEIVHDDDPLMAALGEDAPALHWHGDVFTAPPGAKVLARTEATPVQAFVAGGRAWGLLFHVEADAELLDCWLREPAMAVDARRALGPDYRDILRDQARRLEPERGDAVFRAFAAQCAGVPPTTALPAQTGL